MQSIGAKYNVFKHFKHANYFCQTRNQLPLLLASHQYRFETINIYKRPQYVHYEDGSKWIVGTSFRVYSDGTKIDTNSGTAWQQQPLESVEKVKEMETFETFETDLVDTADILNDEEDVVDIDGIDDESESESISMDVDADENLNENDIRNVRGIGAKTGKILRSKNINTVEELFAVIQNNEELFDELNGNIRGFNKIAERVTQICANK